MRPSVYLLLLAFCLLAVQKGVLNFVDVKSPYDVNGTFMLYIWQPTCVECKIMEEEVFSNPPPILSNLRLYALDISAHPISTVEVYIEQVVYVDHGAVRYIAVRGERTFLIPGTPTVLIGVAEGGRIKLLGFWTGYDRGMRKSFEEFVSTALGRGPPPVESSVSYGLGVFAAAVALGVLSAFSPCVLPVLTLAGVSHFARRNLVKVLAGFVFSIALFGAAVAALGLVAVFAKRAVAAAGGVFLAALGLFLISERLNVKYAAWISPLQSRAFKALGGAGDFLLGMSLGAVWLPCILPYAGFATVLALSSLMGNYLFIFLAFLCYGLGMAAAVYLITRGFVKFGKSGGRSLERAIGVVALAFGIYLIAAAL